ncbi:BZ3500_MvSof-1268-A1-R1_Chr12-2g03854 [Microbotryum saponariae]|uniref:Protein disulfide-isomerase n=1 Tax=Microbotryum saponariae TaxID=289078 RepID=A0A2X0KKZ0_9BASI|nr:BZ3500_MvSof-1268-A1-R1_Chr12-2g03854 [Microbotryum saponariae]
MRFSLLATAALYAAARASSVIDLTTANFDEVAKGDLSLIEFFAPWYDAARGETLSTIGAQSGDVAIPSAASTWHQRSWSLLHRVDDACGHCKALAPHVSWPQLCPLSVPLPAGLVRASVATLGLPDSRAKRRSRAPKDGQAGQRTAATAALPQSRRTLADQARIVLLSCPLSAVCLAYASPVSSSLSPLSHSQYDEASDILAKHGVVLAKVDCTVEADLCSSHGVSGYPTLKIFRKGESSDYGGTRKTAGIVSHMKKQLLPAISDVTASTHDEFSKADKLVFIAYIAEDDKTSKEVFTAFAESHRDDYLFGLSHDAEKVAGVTPPAVVLYKTFDEGRNDFTDKFSSQALDAFAKEHTVPILDEISPDNFAMYAEAGIPLAYIFIPDDHEKRSEITKSIEPIAREHQGKINFVWIDATKFADHAKSLNLLEPTWPSFAIQNIQEMTKFPLDQSKPVDHKTISAFVQDFLGGKIAASIKSEKVPATQDESVFVLVADQFDEVVADKSKDLLVEFYAPWCGHCKKLKPTWDELGEKYAGAKSKVTIAKFDATENDVPASAGFRVSGFPTIKFRAANTNEWISYEGDRTLESLVEFLESNATNDISAADEPAVAGGAANEQTVIADHHDEL